jgi:hypothetical protein
MGVQRSAGQVDETFSDKLSVPRDIDSCDLYLRCVLPVFPSPI